MLQQNRQWIMVDEVVNEYLSEADLSVTHYFKVWHIAFRGMMDMGLDAFFPPKTVKRPLNSNLTATVPADYLSYTKVGVFNQQGEIITMGVNSKLSAAFDLSPDRVSQTTDNTIVTESQQQGAIMWNNYWNGQAFVPVYGLPSGAPFIGSFNMDDANGVIVLSQDYPYDYVILEYVATPSPKGDYVVPVQFKEALIAWIWWKDKKSVSIRRGQVGITRSLRSDYFNEREKAIARYDPIRISDWYEWHLQNQRITVKA
jgi:hypothetical protein